MKYFFLAFSIMTLSALSAQKQNNAKNSTSKTIEKEVTIIEEGDQEKNIKKRVIVLKSQDHKEIDSEVDSLIQSLNLSDNEVDNIDVKVKVTEDGTKTITIEAISEDIDKSEIKVQIEKGIRQAEKGFEVEIDENRVDVEPLPKSKVSLGVEIDENRKIVQVLDGKAAEKAGLVAGDIIVKIDQQKIYSIRGLLEHLGSYQAGDKVKISYERVGQLETAKLQLDSK